MIYKAKVLAAKAEAESIIVVAKARKDEANYLD